MGATAPASSEGEDPGSAPTFASEGASATARRSEEAKAELNFSGMVEVQAPPDLTKIAAIVPVVLSGAGSGGGYGTLKGALPSDPAFAGIVFFSQWFVLDAGASDGVAASEGAEFGIF